MTIKVTVPLLLAVVSTLCPGPALGGLLRTPKVYNAVITTDENLTPSRAYPVVQPVVHEAGLAYPFGAFGPFGLYNAFNAYPGFYQPQPQAPQQQLQQQQQPLPQQQQQLQPIAGVGLPGAAIAQQVQARNNAQFYAPRNPEPQLQDAPIETLPGAQPLPETNLPLREAPVPEVIADPNNSIAPKAPEGPRPNYEERPANNQNSPLQLNEFGLPPSLIPLTAYNGANGQHHQAYNLPGYPYNFPVLYDSFGNYNPTQYQSVLPPFGYFPQLAQPNPYFGQNVPFNAGPLNNAVDPQQANRNGREQDLPEPTPKEDLQSGTPQEGKDADTPESPAEPAEGGTKPEESATAQNVPDSIKNNANKNKDIPDVPPPPIPSGAKEADQ